MKPVRFTAKSVPYAFAIVTILAYGLLLPLTGFYWDDWPFAWIAKFLGPAEFIPAFRGFRPFLGPIFFLTTSLIPSNPLLWQVFALIIRFLSALAAWFALDQIWPSYKRQTLLVALLFLVFPGYSQHWVAFTHINQEWIPFIFYLLSFGFSARALRTNSPEINGDEHRNTNKLNASPSFQQFIHVYPHSSLVKKPYVVNTTIALIFLAAGLFPTEYFIGLEPLRFLFIWIMVSEGTKDFRARLTKTIKSWWPYLSIWIVDAIWLVYYYKSGAYISYDLTAVQTTPPLITAFATFGDALWKAGLYIWAQVLVLTSQTISAPTSLLTLTLTVIVFLFSSFYFFKLDVKDTGAKSPAIAFLILGIIGILLGRIPSFVAGLPLTLQSSFDRFMISLMLGGSLFIAGLVELFVRDQRVRTFVFALLIALGIGQQFFNANIFRRDWQGQQQIYWEFVWRIPALKPDTAVITQQMPLDYETDFSMTAALNWIYAAKIQPPDLPYALVYSEKRLGGIVLPSLQPNTVMQLPYRTVNFTGNTSQAIVIYVPAHGCLRVFDPALGDMETYSRLPQSLIAPIPLSDPSRIVTDVPSPVLPNPPFIKEPAHTWCYFYEKAELARQIQNWSKIVALNAEAAQQDLKPEDAFEWLPFIEGQARAGDLQSAAKLTREARNQNPKIHQGLCVLWKRLQAEGLQATQSYATAMIGELGCGQ